MLTGVEEKNVRQICHLFLRMKNDHSSSLNGCSSDIEARSSESQSIQQKSPDIYGMDPATLLYKIRGKKNGRLKLHLLMWTFYLLACWYLQSISFNPFENLWVFLGALKLTLLTMMVFYPLVYFAWPELFLRRKYVRFIGVVILLILAYGVLDSVTDQFILSRCEACMERVKNDQRRYYQLLQKGAMQVVLVRLISLGIVYEIFVSLSLPISVKVIVEYIGQRIASLELQKENMRLELNFLKSQVNPHFLFNTLNNIYALILKNKKEESAETVSRLSTFLRYSLYETTSESNSANKEIELLRSYVDLEKIRLNDVVVNFNVTTDADHYRLPPLLFVPALENAFKFCSKPAWRDAYIFILLSIKDNLLEFNISNTYETTLADQNSPGGIGLENLKRRLSRYFPGDQHSILITTEQDVYTISISIHLQHHDQLPDR